MNTDFHKIKIDFTHTELKIAVPFDVDVPKKCPICHNKIFPSVENTPIMDTRNESIVFFKCPSCYEIYAIKYFFTDTTINKRTHVTGHKVNIEHSANLISIAPYNPPPVELSSIIEELSPRFKDIYQQAKWANEYNLTDIYGIALRKALEFLIKDYCIFIKPDEQENIKKKFIGNCINDYIDDEKLKVFASRSIWLGNDEGHYIKYHEERNVDDLERFIIQAILCIESQINYIDAESITHKDKKKYKT